MNLPRKMRTHRFPRRQQGLVLLIALTVLVAMSLAGVALVRSVDNTVVIAGNLAFKQSSLQVADRGASDALQWLVTANRNTPFMRDDMPNMGYFSAKPPQEPDWFADTTWNAAATTNGGLPDSSGNTVRYLIHRMCTMPGAGPNDDLQQCGFFYPPTLRQDSNSKSIGSFKYEGAFQLYYRVTTRVDGPRNNVTIVQTTILI
jgi:type IV pilus assembly protein PilX